MQVDFGDGVASSDALSSSMLGTWEPGAHHMTFIRAVSDPTLSLYELPGKKYPLRTNSQLPTSGETSEAEATSFGVPIMLGVSTPTPFLRSGSSRNVSKNHWS